MVSTSANAAAKRILLIEDERGLAEEIRAALCADGCAVDIAETFDDGLSAARCRKPAAIVVDRMLQDRDGLAIIETIRSEGGATPVLVISALSSVDDRIRGLKAGGDDYLVKPFALSELVARVEALLRRSELSRATRLKVGALELDLVEREVRRGGAQIDLLPREFKLLEYFMRRPGQIITREMLLTDIWNYKFRPQTNVVDVHIGNLRRKLDPGDGRRFIVNLRAEGFVLNADA